MPRDPSETDLIRSFGQPSESKLASLKQRHARVVELRFLCALTIQETADVPGVSHATVESDWTMAQAWLRAELAERG